MSNDTETTTTLNIVNEYIFIKPEVEVDLIAITYEGVGHDETLSMDGMRITMEELHEFLAARSEKLLMTIFGTEDIEPPKLFPNLGPSSNFARDLPLG